MRNQSLHSSQFTVHTPAKHLLLLVIIYNTHTQHSSRLSNKESRSSCTTTSKSTSSPTRPISPEAPIIIPKPKQQNNPQPRMIRQEVLLQIPGCTVHLMDQGEALQLAIGDFTLLKIYYEDVFLATTIKVGSDLQWPLTKDEPVIKLDPLHYLFSLPMKDGDPLSYGVSFPEQYAGTTTLASLDLLLKEHTCFSSSSSTLNTKKGIDWKEFAPKIEDYNNVLAKAIAAGTGQIVKGIFICSNAYTNQVQKGGEMILTRSAKEKNGGETSRGSRSNKSEGGDTNKSEVNKRLKRVRKITKMTEKMSKFMLDGVGMATGSVMGPLVRSQAGQSFLNMVPGQVLLASLDAINKVLDAVEVAEKQTLSATSGAATRMVTKRYGESAGEATEDAFATAGHCAGTAWNILKIRKAINPASSVTSGVLRSAAENRKNKT